MEQDILKQQKFPPDDFKEVITKRRPNVKETSVKTYMTTLRGLGIKKTDLSNTEAIKKAVDQKHKTVPSKINAYTAIIVYLKYYGQDTTSSLLKSYEEIFQKLKESLEDTYVLQAKSEKEQENWVSWEDIVSKRDLFKKEYNYSVNKPFELFQKYLILSLYTKIPPLRNDWASVKIDKWTDKDNYVDIEKGLLVLNNYKTDKTYGEKQIKLPKDLLQDITDFIKLRDSENIQSDYLIINAKTLGPIKPNSLTAILKRIFHPKNVSTTMIRKIFLSTKYPVQHTVDDLKKDADVMGHAWTTGYTKYRKKNLNETKQIIQ